MLFRFSLCSWNVMGTQIICVIFVSMFYMHFVLYILTVMSVFWMIGLWTGSVSKVCSESISISILFPLSPYTHLLFVCLCFICRHRRRRLQWGKYLFGWIVMGKEEKDEYLMKSEGNGKSTQPILAHEVCSRNIPYSKSECYVLSPEFVCIWVVIFHVFSEYYGNTINLCYFKSLCIWWMYVAFIAFVFDRYLCIELKDEANVMEWIWTQRTMQ